jgi:serine/threonine-protein kinase
MPSSKVIGDRYELQDPPIGQGGMGVVFKAYDRVTKRFVAIKTMWGSIEPPAVELFEKEWTVLASLCHPNIVDILDTGEFVDNGQHKPYFVMPLLPGATLDKIIKTGGQRLETERMVEIMSQACKALQAAHDRRLVHRDLKPSNIFVMDDDTVKIIDFGVVHLADARTVTGIKGTLHYMAPEQLEMKPATPSSDIFSLGVVCYEALTGNKPFARDSEAAIAEALRTFNPPPVSEINPTVSVAVSRTVHVALAKQPLHRYASVREFAETLRRALRNERIERFDVSKIQTRIDRMHKAFSSGDHQFALEILCELESEGNIDPELSSIRPQIEQAIRTKTVRQLLDEARLRISEGEYDFALPKVISVLEVEPSNVHAQSLKVQIERHRNAHQVEDWLRLAQQHFDNQLFTQARQAAREVMKIDASNTKAHEFTRRVQRRELELSKLRKEQQEFYETALACYRNGEISTALNKLERILDLQRQVSPASQVDPQYQTLYEKILSERDKLEGAYTEGRKALTSRNFPRALELCDEVLRKRPGEPMFQALKLEVEEARRQEKSGAIVRINAQVESEADLDRKMKLLQEAEEQYPEEEIFKQSLKLTKERRDLVHSIVTRARTYEEKSHFSEAISQWDILRNVYGQFPNLSLELERLRRRREEQKLEETKARLVEEIDRLLALGDYGKAEQAAETALVKFPEDGELIRLRTLAQNAERKGRQAWALYEEAQQLSSERNDLAAIVKLRDAMQLDEKNSTVRAALQSALVEYARGMVATNWRGATGFVEEALQIDDSDPIAKDVLSLIEDSERREKVDRFLTEARELEAVGQLDRAIEKLQQACEEHPSEIRLAQLSARLRHTAESKRRENGRRSSAAAGYNSGLAPAAGTGSWEYSGRSARAAVAPDGFAATEVAVPAPTLLNRPHTNATAASISPPPSVPPASPSPAGFEPQPRNAPQSKGRGIRWYWWVAGAVVLAAGGFVFLRVLPSMSPGGIRVLLSADAPNSTFQVDGKPVKGDGAIVSSGAHRVSASADGFRSEEKILDVSATATDPVSIPFHLVPLPPQIQILSDIRSGQAVLDGNVTDLQSGDFSRSDVTPGDHTLKVMREGRQILAFNFKVNPGQPVQVFAPLSGAMSTMVVSSRADSAHVVATPGLSAALAGHHAQPIPSAGADFHLNRGANDFVVSDGRSERHWNLEYLPGPVLFVQLGPARETGTLLIKSNVPDAQVAISTVTGRTFLNGDLVNGVKILSLRPGKYQVKVSKDGYLNLTPQNAEVKKEDRQEVSFDLTPVPIAPPAVTELRPVTPAKADFTIDSLPSGAEVFADNNRMGAAGPSGTVSFQLQPGPHTLTFRKNGYQEYRIAQSFAAKQYRLSASEMAKGEMALLDVSVSPQDAAIRCRREGDSTDHELNNGAKVPLPAGKYEVIATSEGYIPHSESLVLYPGKPNHMEVTLSPMPPAPAPSEANAFQDPASWNKNDADWYVHQSPTYTWFRRSDGVTHLLVYKPERQPLLRNWISRSAHIEWALDDKVDQRIEYSLDENELRRTVVAGGVAGKEVKFPVAPGSQPYFQLDISLTPSEARVTVDGQTLDTVNRPDPGKPPGKFGFRGPVMLVIR